MKKFYRIVVGNLCVNADGGPIYGTLYAMKNACQFCGTGTEPKGPRYMSKLSNVKKKIFEAGYAEILVNLEIAEKLQEAKVTSLAEVFTAKGHHPCPFMEIRGEGILPPFSDQTTDYQISKKQCSHCKRDGYFGIPRQKLKLVYEKVNPQLLQKDILITYERFGYSRLREPFKDSVFAQPLYIVSEKVMNILKNEKVRNVEFVPVTFLE